MQAMMISTHFLHSPLSIFSSSSTSSLRPHQLSACCSLMNANNNQGSATNKLMDFPFVSAPHKNLMVDLVSTLENRFHSQLLPCTLPSDVQQYQSQSGAARASLLIRKGHTHSQVDFVLGSWLHSELPTGGSLDITSLSGYLRSSNDAPDFVFDMIRSSPTMLLVILDLLPRRDLALCPDYIKTFYEDTQLDSHRQALESLPEVQPYLSSSLYIRAITSPTAIFVSIRTESGGGGGEERMEEIIRNHLDPISKQVLGIWLDHCAGFANRQVLGEAERACLKKRDGLIRNNTIENDLGSSYPRLFGPEVADRVLGVIREYFAAS